MKPLIVLLSSFTIALFATLLISKEYNVALSARIGMAVMLIFTAIGHFIFVDGMSMMLPQRIPFKEHIIYLTGVFEIVLAAGILVPRLQIPFGWMLVIFLLMILPANIYAAIHQINYQNASFDGPGLHYLWFRVPLQVVFIVWTYISTIRFA